MMKLKEIYSALERDHHWYSDFTLSALWVFCLFASVGLIFGLALVLFYLITFHLLVLVIVIGSFVVSIVIFSIYKVISRNKG